MASQFTKPSSSGYNSGNSTGINNVDRGFITCPLNCTCCYDFQMGKPCFCSARKETKSTQTTGYDFTNLNCSADSYWKKGTFSHSMLQRYIQSTIVKHNLTSKKDYSFNIAVMEVVTNFPDLGFNTDTKTKISNRMGQALRWMKYSKKRKNTNPDQAEIVQEETPQENESNSAPLTDSDSEDELDLATLSKKTAARKLD